jgi:hypothetical protein
MNIFSCLVCVLGLAVGVVHAEPAKTHSRSKPASSIEMKTTSFLDDGTELVQTRYLSIHEAEAIGVLGGTTAKSAMNGAPPLPNPPLPGSVAPGTTRVDYHQELNGWTRDTSFGRAPGGPWELMNDHLIRNEPPKCNPNDDDCGRVPN